VAARPRTNLLRDARVYLSGPMDFVASRQEEIKHGWRTRVEEFLRALGVTVFNPWHKPRVAGLLRYGIEGKTSTEKRAEWIFSTSRKGIRARAALCRKFAETLHTDLRMVDTSDFVIAHCPTNVYSVGTPHEIAVCRQQRKPVLFVSPSVSYPSLGALRKHLAKDPVGKRLLDQLTSEVPIKENPGGIPSLWYMPLIGADNFFDGFGFARYRKRFGWKHETVIDRLEALRKPKRPLLPFLLGLQRRLPKTWDLEANRYVRDDDWVLWRLTSP
jgi:hypothetical protein